jgi:SP family xylose:H+ symportor-like MFS transporter
MIATRVTTGHIKAVTGSTFVSTLSWVLCGYCTAVVTGVVDALNFNFVAPRALEPVPAHLLLGLIVCAALLGTITGSLAARRVAETMGRKLPIIIAAVLFFVSAIGSAFPEIGIAPHGSADAAVTGMYFFYRFLGGVAVALASFVAPMYVSEFAPSAVRGQIGAYQQIAIAGGICAALFANWGIGLQGNDDWVLATGWRYMHLALAVPALVLFCMSFTVPESNVWLVKRGRVEEARTAIARSAEPEEVSAMMADLTANAQRVTQSAPLLSFGARVLFVAVAINVLQQFMGLTAISYYGPMILQRMGFYPDQALLGVLLARSLNVLATMLVVLVVDRVGRKPLLIVGAIVMGLSMLMLGALLATDGSAILGLVAMCCYLIGLGVSFGPIVWIMLSEIFPAPIRAQATSIAVWSQWSANLLVAVSFPVLFGSTLAAGALGGGVVFWIFGGFALVAGFVVLKFVPETKGVDNEVLGTFWRRQARVPGSAALA